MPIMAFLQAEGKWHVEFFVGTIARREDGRIEPMDTEALRLLRAKRTFRGPNSAPPHGRFSAFHGLLQCPANLTPVRVDPVPGRPRDDLGIRATQVIRRYSGWPTPDGYNSQATSDTPTPP